MGGELIWFICHFWLSCKEFFFYLYTLKCLGAHVYVRTLHNAGTLPEPVLYWQLRDREHTDGSSLFRPLFVPGCNIVLLVLLLPYRICILYSPLFILGCKLAFLLDAMLLSNLTFILCTTLLFPDCNVRFLLLTFCYYHMAFVSRRILT